MMVKDAIDPSGSVPPSPAIATALLGAISRLTLLAIGGWLAGAGVGAGVGVAAEAMLVVTVAPGSLPLLLPGFGSFVFEVLLAVLLTVPVAGAGNLTVRLRVTPSAKLAMGGKVTMPVAGL